MSTLNELIALALSGMAGIVAGLWLAKRRKPVSPFASGGLVKPVCRHRYKFRGFYWLCGKPMRSAYKCAKCGKVELLPMHRRATSDDWKTRKFK